MLKPDSQMGVGDTRSRKQNKQTNSEVGETWARRYEPCWIRPLWETGETTERHMTDRQIGFKSCWNSRKPSSARPVGET